MYDYDYPNSDIKFTELYIARRGWRAAVVTENIHVNVLNATYARNSWHGFEPCPSDLRELMWDLGTDSPHDAMNFWLELNCEGRWDRVGKYKIEFEFASDAMAYKLSWL